MKYINKANTPDDADARRAVPPVICYPTDSLPTDGTSVLAAARQALKKIDEVLNSSLSKEMILSEKIDGIETKRIKSIAFQLSC